LLPRKGSGIRIRCEFPVRCSVSSPLKFSVAIISLFHWLYSQWSHVSINVSFSKVSYLLQLAPFILVTIVRAGCPYIALNPVIISRANHQVTDSRLVTLFLRWDILLFYQSQNAICTFVAFTSILNFNYRYRYRSVPSMVITLRANFSTWLSWATFSLAKFYVIRTTIFVAFHVSTSPCGWDVPVDHAVTSSCQIKLIYTTMSQELSHIPTFCHFKVGRSHYFYDNTLRQSTFQIPMHVRMSHLR